MQAGTTVDDLASALGIPAVADGIPNGISDGITAQLSTDDVTFVAALQAGSEYAFNQLITLYHQPVYSLVARSLHDPADAADITQEVFIKIYRGIHGFHGESSLRTWIYRIALHEASNQRRWWSRHKRQEVTIETETAGSHPDDPTTLCLGDTLADPRCSPYEACAQQELRSTVAAALAQVPHIFRSVLVLREIEGYTYDEIAELLQIQVGTVKSRLMRGRNALRLALTGVPSARPAKQPAKQTTLHRATTPAVTPAPSIAELLEQALHLLPLQAAKNRAANHVEEAL